MSDHPATDPLQQLLDRQAIIDCLHRYTRGADRRDLPLLRSAFHEDARRIDRTVRSVDEPIAIWEDRQAERQVGLHYLTNHAIDINGDIAHSEAYYLTIIKQFDNDETQSMVGGRYIDKLERRNGEWKILTRHVAIEWMTEVKCSQIPHLGILATNPGPRDGSDPSYNRPLVGPQ